MENIVMQTQKYKFKAQDVYFTCFVCKKTGMKTGD